MYYLPKKHIDIKYHSIRELIQKKVMNLQYVSTDEKIADILTKTLSKLKFVYFRDKMGVRKTVSLTGREC